MLYNNCESIITKNGMDLQCSSNAGADMSLVFRKQSRKSEISDFRSKFFIKENVGEFYVSMYDSQF